MVNDVLLFSRNLSPDYGPDPVPFRFYSDLVELGLSLPYYSFYPVPLSLRTTLSGVDRFSPVTFVVFFITIVTYIILWYSGTSMFIYLLVHRPNYHLLYNVPKF